MHILTLGFFLMVEVVSGNKHCPIISKHPHFLPYYGRKGH